MNKVKIFSVIILALLVFSGTPLSFGRVQNKDWAFIFYLDADNNLGVYAEEDLAEIMQVDSNINVNVVILYDTYEEPVITYKLEGGALIPLTDFSLNGLEVDMGDPNTIGTFLDYVFTNYAANRYFLVIWDHGDDFRGTCRDEHTNNPDEERGFLYHNELVPVLDNKNKNKRIDILAFDACVQGMIEVAYYYRDVADILIGTEDYMTYHGLTYDKIIEKLEYEPGISNEEFAEYVVDAYVGAYIKKNGTGGGGYTEAFPTLSAIKLDGVNRIVDSLNELVLSLKVGIETYRGVITNARAASIMGMPMFGWEADIDLYTFVEKIGGEILDEEIPQKADAVMEAIDDAVYMNCSFQFSMMQAHGLGIFFPSSLGSMNHNMWLYGVYYQNEVSFAKETEWLPFLLEYYGMEQ